MVLCALCSGTTHAAELGIQVTGLRSEDGLLRLALFSEPAEFPSGAAVRRIDLPAKAGSMHLVLHNLAPATYAIALFHDEDGDNEFDRGFLGIPREGYGFSRDAWARWSAPSFNDAAIAISEGGANITVMVRYWW